MNDKTSNDMSNEERMLREKARQSLRKNKTPTYSSDDIGGLLSGPETEEEMKKQAEENDE